MGTALGIIGIAVVAGVSFAFSMNQRKKWQAALRAVADRHDLFLDHGSLFQAPKTHGVVEGIPITVDTFTTSSGKSKTIWSRIKADPPKLPGGLELKPESTSFLGKMFRGVEHVIGDPHFDEKVFVQGPEPVVRALLDQETRDQVVAALAKDVKVHDNCIEWTRKGHAEEWIVLDAFDAVLDLSRRLSRRGDAAALAQIVRTDLSDVAAEALQVMPRGPERAALCAEILARQTDRLALIAARLQPDGAASAVERVARHRKNSVGVRIEALTWLKQHADATACARDCLDHPRIAAAALDALAKADPPVSLDTLVSLVASRDSAAAALRHARRHGVAAEPLLIQMLDHEDPEIATVAANGLWLVGTANAVPALRAKSSGLFMNSQLKSAALAAIEEIQGRAGSERGALTVVEAGEGQLSEPDAT
jgi:hypothetical protein